MLQEVKSSGESVTQIGNKLYELVVKENKKSEEVSGGQAGPQLTFVTDEVNIEDVARGSA